MFCKPLIQVCRPERGFSPRMTISSSKESGTPQSPTRTQTGRAICRRSVWEAFTHGVRLNYQPL